jgi:hypothetical protein
LSKEAGGWLWSESGLIIFCASSLRLEPSTHSLGFTLSRSLPREVREVKHLKNFIAVRETTKHALQARV